MEESEGGRENAGRIAE